MLKRKIDTFIRNFYKSSKNALLITGARQIGKTFSIREIAQILEIKEGTVKSRLYKARLVLNQILTKQNQFIKVGE